MLQKEKTGEQPYIYVTSAQFNEIKLAAERMERTQNPKEVKEILAKCLQENGGTYQGEGCPMLIVRNEREMMPRLTGKAEKALEKAWQLRNEAVEILKLIVLEWESDPMSAQCFDLRLVVRSKLVISELEEIDKDGL